MDINEVLSSFNSNQLKQINDFLSSIQSSKTVPKFNEADKKNILKRLESLNPNDVKERLSRLSADDIKKMLK